jgi:hypothetical protein
MKCGIGGKNLPKVYNKHHNDYPTGSIYVGRGTPWGNPYKIGHYHPSIPGKVMGRGDVVALYREHIKKDGMERLIKQELKGKNLVCFCAPLACHADVLLEIANED